MGPPGNVPCRRDLRTTSRNPASLRTPAERFGIVAAVVLRLLQKDRPPSWSERPSQERLLRTKYGCFAYQLASRTCRRPTIIDAQPKCQRKLSAEKLRNQRTYCHAATVLSQFHFPTRNEYDGRLHLTAGVSDARSPRGRNDHVEIREPRLKSDEVACERRVSDKHWRISGSPPRLDNRDRTTGNAFDRTYDAANRSSGAEINYQRGVTRIEVSKRLNVRGGKIADVDEIAFARSVSSWIIGSERSVGGPMSRGCIYGKRDQMSLRIVPLNQVPFRIRAGCIEIAQHSDSQVVRSVRICEDLLANELGSSVGIDRMLRGIFRNR
jgi:hypothetical protein